VIKIAIYIDTVQAKKYEHQKLLELYAYAVEWFYFAKKSNPPLA
jgi:hypothetical protein